eukprot:scaffold70131_cov66-Cyclotella_meneghiniana.AAC.10
MTKMRIRACLIAALVLLEVVGAVKNPSLRLKEVNSTINLATESSHSLRRRLTAIQCDSVVDGTCYVDTPKIFASDVAFAPSSLLLNGTSLRDSVKNLSLRSIIECTGLFCNMIFQKFNRLEVSGSLVGSDIRIEVETLYVAQGGMISGSELGYAAEQGPSPADMHWDCHWTYGAGHGGPGGSYPDSTLTEKSITYNSETQPADFGSGGLSQIEGGGDNLNGGGKIYIMGTEEVKVDGTISEDGGACGEGACCASASGGSIYISSDKVVGVGHIRANGGALPKHYSEFQGDEQTVASGAGGRIAIYHNALSSTLTIEASGGAISDQLYSHAQGSKGTVYTDCLSSFCYNGGTKTECMNGGRIDESTCSCSCEPEWKGHDCSQCDDAFLCNSNGACSALQQTSANLFFSGAVRSAFSCTCDPFYYGQACDTYCHPLITCEGYGSCSMDGKSCQCTQGKVGDDCFCDAQDCSLPNACSGRNGTCTDSMCDCKDGFVGCDCSIECSASRHCSGNGSCNRDGTCTCKEGFSGSNCGEQDITSYCSDTGNTITGFPCLPGINDKLGYGFNAVNGERTIPILVLLYTNGRTKTIDGQTYELPDNVECEEVTTSNVNFNAERYLSTSSYRRELLQNYGVSGGHKSGVYMSASAEYGEIYGKSFQEGRVLFQSQLVHGTFRCYFQRQQNPSLSRAVQNAIASQWHVRNIGTHYFDEVTLGGRISVFYYVHACVEKTDAGIQSKISTSARTLVAAGEADAGIISLDSELCSEYNTYYKKMIEGGKRELLLINLQTGEDFNETDDDFNEWTRALTGEDFNEWFGSLVDKPGMIKSSVNDIYTVLPSITNALETYIDDEPLPEEVEINTDNLDCSCGEEVQVTKTCIGGDTPLFSCTADKIVYARDVSIGDQIRSINAKKGESSCSDVYYVFAHKELNAAIRITTSQNESFTVSYNHIVYIGESFEKRRSVLSQDVKPGDELVTTAFSKKVVTVLKVENVEIDLVDVLTIDPHLEVQLQDGIVISAHSIHETAYGVLFAPIRYIYVTCGAKAVEYMKPLFDVIKFLFIKKAGIHVHVIKMMGKGLTLVGYEV